MKSKYLIGIIPSVFILLIACLAKAAPVGESLVASNTSLTLAPAIMFLVGAGLIGIATWIKRQNHNFPLSACIQFL